MSRLVIILLLAATFITGVARAEECTTAVYEGLVSEAKSADTNRLWDSSVSLYRRILDDCRDMMAKGDLAKLYDALAVGLLMQEQYSEALDIARKCLDEESSCNACMLTAARAYEGLGDRDMAIQLATEASLVEAGDEYSSAVVIYAKDFLKKLEKEQPK